MPRCLAALLAVAVTACGGPSLSADEADRLAGRAEEVAALVRDGRVCDARDRAASLERTAAEAGGAGRVPAAVATEIADVAGTLRAELAGACDDDGTADGSPLPDSPGPGDADDGPPDERDEQDEPGADDEDDDEDDGRPGRGLGRDRQRG